MRYSLLIAVALSLGFTGRAAADTSFADVRSVEAITDGSQLIVLGTVIREQPAGAKDGKTRIKEVGRALKGTIDKKAIPDVVNLSDLVTAPGENPAILFLVPAEKPKTFEIAYIVYLNKHKVPATGWARYYSEIIPWDCTNGDRPSFHNPKCAVLDKTGAVLTDPDAVIERVVARAKLHPHQIDGGFYNHNVRPDLDSFQNSVIYNVQVPFDPEFQKDLLAQLNVRDGYQRYVVAAQLRHYKHDEVIAALKKCLTDDYIRELPVEPTKKDSPTKNYFAVRRAAYETLRSWGIDVKQPELEAPPDAKKPR